MISIEAYRTTIGSYLTKARRISASAHLSSRNAKHFNYKYTNKSCAGIFQTTNSSLYFLRVFGCFVLILTLYVNMNMSFLKLMSLLTDGDVESNPGPTYTILKVVQGSFNQANKKFGETAEDSVHVSLYFQLLGLQFVGLHFGILLI